MLIDIDIAPKRLLACCCSGGSTRSVTMRFLDSNEAQAQDEGQLRGSQCNDRSSSKTLFGSLLGRARKATRAFSSLVAAAFMTAAMLFSSPTPPQSARPSPGGRSSSHPVILFVEAACVKEGQLAERFPSGSRIVRLEEWTRKPRNLTPSFFSAADPRVSFDGSRVLFAGKKEATQSWQIWEMNADGTGQRQVTHLDSDCLGPVYLPRDAIAFSGEVRETGGRRAFQVFFGRLDGTDVHPITFGPGDFEVETVLQNGLILASARSPLEVRGRSENSRNLYTLRPDGSGLAAFRCDREAPAIRSQAEELDDGSVVFVKKAAVGSGVGGDLAAIRRGATHNSILGPARELIWSPRQLEAARLIVARRADEPRQSERFDLYSFDYASGKLQAPIYQDPEFSSIEAVPVAAHPAPRWYWSTLRLEIKAGYFICLNAALSGDASKDRLAPFPTEVRVLALDPATETENSLGQAPIEPDGSFYVAVPPDRPVRFEVLGADGRIIRRQQSWVWARPGEEHGCVGCHEDRAVAPENRWPLALRRIDAPSLLGVSAPLDAAH